MLQGSEALEPVKEVVELSCRRDSNRLTADAALKYLLAKVESQATVFSTRLA